jgi:hypothetical protein
LLVLKVLQAAQIELLLIEQKQSIGDLQGNGKLQWMKSVILKGSRGSCSHLRTKACKQQRVMVPSSSSLPANTLAAPSLSRRQEGPIMFL